MEEMVMALSDWSGKRVFLTGHTGFKGSWLALWLQHLGANVFGYSLPPPTDPSLFEIAQVSKGMQSFNGDVRDLNALSSAMTQFKPEVVLHLAAQSLVKASYSDPVATYAINTMGTVHVLEAIRATESVKAVVVVTSDKCYENNEWSWGYRESDPIGGHDPYSNSKGCAELVTSAYRRSFFSSEEKGQHPAAVATARAGNVIGGGDWATDRLVPDFIRAMSKGEQIHVRSPHAQRPWQHVLEPLRGYLLLAERLLKADGKKYASGWNFGPNDDDAIEVAGLVEKLTSLWGDGAASTTDNGPKAHEAMHLKLDSSRARALLGWRPILNVDKSLQWTVDWHKAHASANEMRQFTIAQVERFSAST